MSSPDESSGHGGGAQPLLLLLLGGGEEPGGGGGQPAQGLPARPRLPCQGESKTPAPCSTVYSRCFLYNTFFRVYHTMNFETGLQNRVGEARIFLGNK